MLPLSNQWCIYNFALPLGPAPDNGQIFFLYLRPLHHQYESACKIMFFINEYEGGGRGVWRVKKRYRAAGSDFVSETSAQFLPQSSRAVRFRGMNEEKWGFIDDGIIVSFFNDFEID